MESNALLIALGILVDALALLVAFSGVRKLQSLAAFRDSLLFIPYFPNRLASQAAYTFASAEVIGGAGLLLGKKWGSIVLLGMLAITAFVSIVSNFKKVKVPCVCFGSSSGEVLSQRTILRSIALAMIAVVPILTRVDTQQPLIVIYAAAFLFIGLSINLLIGNSISLKAQRSK